MKNKKVNEILKAMNSTLKEDSKWKNRFSIRKVLTKSEKYSDDSGTCAFYYVKITDAKTKKSQERWFDESVFQLFNGAKVFYMANDFIIECLNY